MSTRAQSSLSFTVASCRRERERGREEKREKEQEYLSTRWSKDLGEAKLKPPVLKIFKSLHSLRSAAKKACGRKLQSHRREKERESLLILFVQGS